MTGGQPLPDRVARGSGSPSSSARPARGATVSTSGLDDGSRLQSTVRVATFLHQGQFFAVPVPYDVRATPI